MARSLFRVDVRTLIVLVASSGAVIWAYQRVRDTTDPVNRWTRLARAGDAAERRESIRMLFDHRMSEEVGSLFVKAMDDPDPGVRAEATNAVGQLQTDMPGGIEAIIRNLDAPEPEVRRAAAMAMRLKRDLARSGMPALLAHAKDPEPSVREAVFRAISAVEPDPNVSQPILLAGLDDPSIDVRRASIEVVGMATLPPVVRLLDGEDHGIAMIAATKLAANFRQRMTRLQSSQSDREIFDGLVRLSRRSDLLMSRTALLALYDIAGGLATVRQDIDPQIAFARAWGSRFWAAVDTSLPVGIGARGLVEPAVSISEEVRRSTERYPEETLKSLRANLTACEKATEVVKGELERNIWRDLDSTDLVVRRLAAQSLSLISHKDTDERVAKLFNLLEDDFSIRQAVLATMLSMAPQRLAPGRYPNIQLGGVSPLVGQARDRVAPPPLPSAWKEGLPALIEAFEIETDGGNLETMAVLLSLYTSEADRVVSVLHEALKKPDRIGPAFSALTPLLNTVTSLGLDPAPLRPLPATLLKLLDDRNAFTRSQAAALLYQLRTLEPEGREAHASASQHPTDAEIRRIASTGQIWRNDPRNPQGRLIRLGTPPPPAAFAPPPPTTTPPRTGGDTSQASGPKP